MMLSCRQTSPSRELAVGDQAGELGAGAGAAGRAVVGLAGAEDEVPAVGPGRVGRAEQLDVVDLAAVRAGDALRASSAWRIRQVTSVSRSTFASVERLAVVVDEEEPVAAPGDVADDRAEARRRRPRRPSPAGSSATLSIATRLRPVERRRRRRRPASRAGASPGADPAQVGQRDGHADRAVAAHAEVADVVEEDHAGRARRVGRLAEQRADHHVRAARLVDHGRAERVVPVAEDRQPLGHRARGPGRARPRRRRASARRRCGCRSR